MTSTLDTAASSLRVRTWKTIGTSASVVVQHPEHVPVAVRMLRGEIGAFDRASSRFRPDSELQMLQAHAGRTVRVSALLFEAIDVACEVARRTGGAVDPTVGTALVRLGYDRDLRDVQQRSVEPGRLAPAVGYQHVQLQRANRTVRIPRGVVLDLGASTKALIADRAASRIAHETGTGVLVSIGGDIAVAGEPPAEGWAVGIAPASATPAEEADQVVAIRSGGLASSSTSVRTWSVGGRQANHIIDPRTGDCVAPYWALVSAAGASCVEANMVTTAAHVWGADALSHLGPFDQAMRLVRHDGRIMVRHGWPEGQTP